MDGQLANTGEEKKNCRKTPGRSEQQLWTIGVNFPNKWGKEQVTKKASGMTPLLKPVHKQVKLKAILFGNVQIRSEM